MIAWYRRLLKHDPNIDGLIAKKKAKAIEGMETTDIGRVNAWGRRNAEMIAKASERCRQAEVQ